LPLLLSALLFVIPQRSGRICGCSCSCPCRCRCRCLFFCLSSRRDLRLQLLLPLDILPQCRFASTIFTSTSWPAARTISYIGFTNNIFRRIAEHRTAPPDTYTAHYNINRLVHYEHFTYVLNAIAREKELKNWTREKKLELIQATNPTWQDLAHDW
jgi:putative endonuclease